MTTFQAGHIDRGETVWVWDGSWLPATVADMVLEPGGECLIVRCENGASAPASFADVEAGKNRARDFSAIEGRSAERASQPRGKQYRRKPEKREIGPRKVSIRATGNPAHSDQFGLRFSI
jgi:hypothetical protein